MSRRRKPGWKELTIREKKGVVKRVNNSECHNEIMRDYGICSGQLIHVLKENYEAKPDASQPVRGRRGA